MRHFEVNPPRIKFGAVVRLKSGGPNMLVVDVNDPVTPAAVWCAWRGTVGEVIEAPFFSTSLMQMVEQ